MKTRFLICMLMILNLSHVLAQEKSKAVWKKPSCKSRYPHARAQSMAAVSGLIAEEPLSLGKEGKLLFTSGDVASLAKEDETSYSSHCFLRRPAGDEFKGKEISFPAGTSFQLISSENGVGTLSNYSYYGLRTVPIINGKQSDVPITLRLDCAVSYASEFMKSMSQLPGAMTSQKMIQSTLDYDLENLSPNLCPSSSATMDQTANPVEQSAQGQSKSGTSSTATGSTNGSSGWPVGQAK